MAKYRNTLEINKYGLNYKKPQLMQYTLYQTTQGITTPVGWIPFYVLSVFILLYTICYGKQLNSSFARSFFFFSCHELYMVQSKAAEA